MEEGLRAGGVKVAGVSSDFMADNSNQPKGGTKSNVDTGTTGVDRQHDGMHHTPSYASFLHEESSQRKVNFRTLEMEQTELADVLIPISLVFEVHAWFENTLYRYFLRMNVAFPVCGKWTPSSKLLGDELTSVHVWIKFHGVPVLAFTANGLSGITTRLDTPVMNLRKQGGTSNDGFQIVQMKGVRDPLVSKHGTGGNHSLPMQQEDNEKRKPMDDLFDGTMKKVGAPHMNTGIWLGRKAEYSSESGFMSPNHFDFLTKEDENSILRDLQESDDV
ncbi:hypothetical protein Tco_0710426 [Tanacetum coccineum]